MPRGSSPTGSSHFTESERVSTAISEPCLVVSSAVLFTTYRVLPSGDTARPMGSTPTGMRAASFQSPRRMTDTLRSPRLET